MSTLEGKCAEWKHSMRSKFVMTVISLSDAGHAQGPAQDGEL